MPIKQLIFVLACLSTTLLIRRLLNAIVLIPTVFLHLLLGIGLAAAVKAGVGSGTLSVVTDGSTVQSIGLLGWLGSLLLLALGSPNTGEGPVNGQTAKISIIGFGGTFLCASALGYLTGLMQPQLKGASAGLPAFAMAIGLACAVTALPVLVSLLHERGEDSTPLGKLAIRVAVVDDIWMWLLLIVVIGMVRPEVSPAVHAMKVVALVVGSRLLLHPALESLYRYRPDMSHANCMVLGLSVIITMAVISESVGTHALFGAFLAGWSLPSALVKTLRMILLPVVQTLLVPFFFITTGLKTDISFSNANFLLLAVGFTVMGVGLKMTFATLAARYSGLRWAQALRLGSLLQCKGLMEIVALGLMRDEKIIGPEVFSALIVMALSCTALTVPLHSLVMRFNRPARSEERPNQLASAA